MPRSEDNSSDASSSSGAPGLRWAAAIALAGVASGLLANLAPVSASTVALVAVMSTVLAVAISGLRQGATAAALLAVVLAVLDLVSPITREPMGAALLSLVAGLEALAVGAFWLRERLRRSARPSDSEFMQRFPEAAIQASAQGRLQTVNDAAESLLARPSSELLGVPLQSLMRLPGEGGRDAEFADLATLGQPTDAVVLGPAGERRDVRARAVPFAVGKDEHFAIHLRPSDPPAPGLHPRLLQALVEASDAAIAVKLADRRYAMVNRRFRERLVPRAGVDPLGRSDEELFDARTAALLRAPEDEVWRDGARRVVEQRLPSGEGGALVLRDTFPLADDAGGVYAVCSMFVDIDARARRDEEGRRELQACRQELATRAAERDDAQGALAAARGALDVARRSLDEARARLETERAARLEAERVNAARDEFVGLVSHELRTPLNAMVGWLHVIESGKSFGEQAMARAGAGLSRAVQQQRELVDTLLDAARALRGELRLEHEPLDLAALVTEAVERRRAQTPALQIETRLPAAGCRIEADPAWLRRVLDELLGHAAKFADLGPLVVRLDAEPSRAPGQATALLTLALSHPDGAAAWAPFQAVDPQAPVPARRRGVGLGLVLAQRVVELLGGSLRAGAAAAAGAGAGAGAEAAAPAVELRLPVAGGEPGACAGQDAAEGLVDDGPADDGPAAGVDLSGLRVLVVDDQPEMREVLSTLLGQYGASVRAAPSAAEAASLYGRLAAGEGVDLGVLDIAMPGEDGISLVRRLREMERANGWGARPMIALTAHASAAMREQALAAGFDRFLAKPLSPAELCTTIARLAGRLG